MNDHNPDIIFQINMHKKMEEKKGDYPIITAHTHTHKHINIYTVIE